MRGLQRIVSISLLIFVAVSVVYLAIGEQGESNTASLSATENGPNCRDGEPCSDQAAVQSNSKNVTTVAYYFHRTARCRTCRALESSAREAIQGTFADQLSGGTLLVKSLNVEEPSNRRFIEQYQITGPSLVLSKMEGKKEVTWKNLNQIWQLIRTPTEYKAYVVSELESFMKAQS